MSNLNESDWKLFRSKLEVLREKYLSKKNSELVKLLSDTNKSATEQFWDTLEELKKEEAILKQCLDGYTRSNMFLHILAMCRCGMMREVDLQQFSDELQNSVNSFLEIE